MLRPKRPDESLTKSYRYFQRKARHVLELLRIRAPDPHHSKLVAEARRQGVLLCGAPEETEAIEFIEASFDWPNVI